MPGATSATDYPLRISTASLSSSLTGKRTPLPGARFSNDPNCRSQFPTLDATLIYVTTVQEFNTQLQGSPYQFPEDVAGESKANYIDTIADSIEQRSLVVQNQFWNSEQSIVDRMDEILEDLAVYESNQIESAGLGLAETAAAIREFNSQGGRLQEYLAEQMIRGDDHLLEVIGLHRANLFVRELVDGYVSHDRLISESDIRGIHKLTMYGEDFSGSYRKYTVEISGSSHAPPLPIDVPGAMNELVAWMNDSTATPLIKAAVVHSWMSIVHPFEDGNGRVARLLANVMLLKAGWPCLIVKAGDRTQYIDALGHSDEAGDLLPLTELFAKSIRRVLKDLERPDRAQKLFDADIRRAQSARLNDPEDRYAIWHRNFRHFLDEFSDLTMRLGFSMMKIDEPSQSTLLMLEDSDPLGNMWLTKVRRSDGADFLLWLGFMSHRMFDQSNTRTVEPSLFLSEQDLGASAVHYYTNALSIDHEVTWRIQEISILPSLEQSCVLVRGSGDLVSRVSIEEGAVLLAEDMDRVASSIWGGNPEIG